MSCLHGVSPLLKGFFFSNAALLKTVAVMSLQTLGQKEADNYSPERQKQNQNKPQPKQTTQHTKPGSGCGKRDVKRVVKRRETACQFTIQKPSYAQMCTFRKYHSQSNQSRSSPTLNQQLTFESTIHHHR